MTAAVPRPEDSVMPASKQAVSSKAASTFESHEIHVLTEIGFLAAGVGQLDHALRIFEALHLMRPLRAFPMVGKAIALMNTHQNTQAVECLESIKLPDAQEQAQLDVWLGFALQQAGHHHAARRILRSILKRPHANLHQNDRQLTALADALLNRAKPDMALPCSASIPLANHGEPQ